MFDNIRKLIKLKRHNDLIPLPEGFDSEVFREVMVRAKTPEQQTRVLRATYRLTQLWKYGNTSHIPRVIVMVKATYPHLEHMADLEMFSPDWLDQLAIVMQLTAGSADGLVVQPELFRQLLREALDHLKSD